MLTIKKGDKVKVIAGKDRGREGAVAKVVGARLIVEGVSLVKRRQKPRRAGQKGEVVEVARPIDRSNVMLYCSHCRRGVRLAAKIVAGKKTRVCRRCGQTI